MFRTMSKSLDNPTRKITESDTGLNSDLIGERVLGFYRELPFNQSGSTEELAVAVKKTDPLRRYPCLAEVPDISRVLEIGCGVGWFSNSLAHRFGSSVLGIDFNPVAIAQAASVSSRLGVPSQFLVANLFDFAPTDNEKFKLVVSLGVLHHTYDCHGAIQKICKSHIAPSGSLLLGLYHLYGRRPFLSHFRKLAETGASREDLVAEYSRLHGNRLDATHLESWFRDQVLHPYETQHTYDEIQMLLDSLGFDVVSTSINKFQPIRSRDEIVDLERSFEAVSLGAISEGRYFPGFFVVLAKSRT